MKFQPAGRSDSMKITINGNLWLFCYQRYGRSCWGNCFGHAAIAVVAVVAAKIHRMTGHVGGVDLFWSRYLPKNK